MFAVTGVSRASALVTDISSGYFDRLLLTPMRRAALSWSTDGIAAAVAGAALVVDIVGTAQDSKEQT